MLKNLDKAPFPWFGGKSKAAPLVWDLLGDVTHYVEPFAGSLAVLLGRPHPCNRPYHSETVNDADGLLVNTWRAIQLHPEETARHASWPVTEADKVARQIGVLQWRESRQLDRLMGSAEWCDTQMAGWWLYGVCAQIGAFADSGPWTVDPETGRIFKQGRAVREPGVSRDRPHLGNHGQGINRPGVREPGVKRGRPHLTGAGRGVNRPGVREPGVGDFHPITMPELVRWFQWLSARLRHVRIVNGDWARVCTGGAMFTLTVRAGKSPVGVFVDPPYGEAERAGGLYQHETVGDSLPGRVREWALRWGDDPRCRIVVAGFDTEHDELEAAGWTVHEWFKAGHLTGGMGQQKRSGTHQQHRERLWASPHCLPVSEAPPDPTDETTLFTP